MHGMVRAGQRVSTRLREGAGHIPSGTTMARASTPTNNTHHIVREHRRFGFTVREMGGAGDAAAWLVRFDDGMEETVKSCRLRVEQNSFGLKQLPVDELFEARFLPTARQRREEIFSFDTRVFDLRSWLVDAVL